MVDMTDKQHTWFITGAGRGMGVNIAQAALAAGYAVVATGRDPEKVADAIGAHDNLLTVALDITDPEAATAAVQAAVDRFGSTPPDYWRNLDTELLTDLQRVLRSALGTIDGELKNDGIVTFEQVGDDQTRINVEMDVEGESGMENVAGELLGVVKSQVRGDLERFKQLIESRGEETGAFRGEVQDGETQRG